MTDDAWVGHLFTYVKTWERGRVNDEQLSRYIARFFCRGPRRPRYIGVAVY